DILGNNAGMLTQARCVDLTLAMWNDMLRIDLTSVVGASERAFPHMIVQRCAGLINVASPLCIKCGPQLTHQARPRAGVRGLRHRAAPGGLLGASAARAVGLADDAAGPGVALRASCLGLPKLISHPPAAAVADHQPPPSAAGGASR
ncbi:SDR family NAD(P)-dependent oxidoreductase, partial [Pseudomonas syringae]